MWKGRSGDGVMRRRGELKTDEVNREIRGSGYLAIRISREQGLGDQGK
jgi:hypothetical protein